MSQLRVVITAATTPMIIEPKFLFSNNNITGLSILNMGVQKYNHISLPTVIQSIINIAIAIS